LGQYRVSQSIVSAATIDLVAADTADSFQVW